MINIPKQVHNRVIVSVTDNTIVLEGEIDHNDPELFIKPFFDKLLLQNYDLLIIDIKNLEYLNSSGIKCLLDFIKAKPRNAKIRIKIDMKKKWQYKSMVVIQSIDEKNISLELIS
jgi:anti-anti-sigma factor